MVCLQDVVVIWYNPFIAGGDIHYLFCENEDKENFSGNIALIMLYVQQMLYAVNYLHQSCDVLHLDIKGAFYCYDMDRINLLTFGPQARTS